MNLWRRTFPWLLSAVYATRVLSLTGLDRPPISAPTLPEIGSQELRPNQFHLFPLGPAIKPPSWLYWMYYLADAAYK
jgi:hypothetical protein